MYMYGELPSDLEDMDESLGPPPSWFNTFYSGRVMPNMMYMPNQFYGLGDREQEVEVNPVERIQELKYNQEMSKKIPIEANRYTKIDPLSPLFRDRLAKYGFGSWDILSKNKLVTVGLVALAAYLFYVKNK